MRLSAALLAGVFLLSVMVMPAAAVQTNTTATPSSTANGTANATATDSGSGFVTRIDGDATVVDAEHENGSIVLTIQSDVFKSATISGTVGGEDGGGGSYAIKTVDLFEGETTVRVAAPMVDGEATATIVTTACVDAGRCGYVQIGDSGGGSLLTGGSTLGWLGGSFTALLSAIVAVWLLVRQGNDAPEEV